ncbi:MAG: 16S rRNA processing protein RimM [Clostridiaceae bacterium]|jgi:16S rRNA processing protein RimM|nr:16S rRNA processing protein RimM [Clostridiaceae bacterium]
MYEYLQVGRIVNTHGVRGEVKLMPLTDDPSRFDDLEWVFIENDGVMTRYEIQSVKYFKGMVIVKLAGIDDPETAAALKGCFALVDRVNAVRLPEGSYFICDIIGCSVFDENGALLGKVSEVLQTGSNDVYVVRDESGREVLIPALKSVVRNVQPEQGRIDVMIPKGLLDDEV